MSNIEAMCPECKKPKQVRRDNDGYGNEKDSGPYRFPLHIGNQYGRPCKMSGQLVPDPPGITETAL